MAKARNKSFKLSGEMTLDTRTFTASLKSVSDKMGKFARDSSIAAQQASKKWGALGKDMMLIGGAASVAAFAGLKKIVDTGGQINDLSNQLGISTNALTELKYAAGLSGVAMEDLSRGIQKMERTLGAGSGDDALEMLGLDAETIKAAAPDEAFTQIIDSIGKFKGSQNEKMDLAQSIFGKGGGSFLRLAKEGSAGLAALREEAKQMGLSLDADAVSKLDDLGDNMDRVTGRVSGLGTAIGMKLVPALETGVDALSGTVQWVGKLTGEFPTFTKYAIIGAGAFGGLTLALGGTFYAYSKIMSTWSNALKIGKDLTGWIGKLTAAKKIEAAATVAKTTAANAEYAAMMKEVDRTLASTTAVKTETVAINENTVAKARNAAATGKVNKTVGAGTGAGFGTGAAAGGAVSRFLKGAIPIVARATVFFGNGTSNAMGSEEFPHDWTRNRTRRTMPAPNSLEAAMARKDMSDRERADYNRQLEIAEKQYQATLKQNEHLERIANNTRNGSAVSGRMETAWGY